MYKLSPSDFAYLYEDCKYCYYQKIKSGVTLPSMPMPGIFSAINTRAQGLLTGKTLRTLSPDLPEGTVIKQEGWVESKAIPGTNLYLKGKYDLLVKRSDGTFLLVDLKLSQPHEDKIDKYKTQLYSYKYALENPVFGVPTQISKLGLLIMYPDTVKFVGGQAVFDFSTKWLEVPLDEKLFLLFMNDVNSLLAGPEPEENPENCKWCYYRSITKKEEKFRKHV